MAITAAEQWWSIPAPGQFQPELTG